MSKEMMEKFDEIPDLKLGEAPETFTFNELRMYRLTTIKRGLVAAYEETIVPGAITDALVDLRHLADHCGADFGECLKQADCYYRLETPKVKGA